MPTGERLSLGRASVLIEPRRGGRLASVLLDGVELLGHGDPASGIPAGWVHGSFPMAPYAGRVRHGEFDFAGHRYSLPVNFEGHATHGLVCDVAWHVDARGEDQLALSTDLDSRWPFGGRVEQHFLLDESGLTVVLRVISDRLSMPASLGFHPWFRRRNGIGGEAEYDVAPLARFAPDRFGFPRHLGADLGTRPWDDVFRGLRKPPTIRWPRGPSMRITSSSDIWIVYEQQPQAFCIEPVTAPPDSLATPQTTVLDPGESLSLEMRLAWV